MNHTEALTRYTANFIDELVRSGVTDVVISPGSRSTPLAMTVCEHEGLREWILVDERSASYFALGMAKETKRAVALICTSGTAAANYFPAIVEAHHSRVPLVILTADRPHELRDTGAPQAIDQDKMYGNVIHWYHDMALPEANIEMLSYVRSQAARAVHEANGENCGPVHLNFPYREPLIPDFTLNDLWKSPAENNYHPLYEGERRLSSLQMEEVGDLLAGKERGLIVVGPQVDDQLASTIVQLATTIGVPILADPLSQVRAGAHHKEMVIDSYDAILRSAVIRKELQPDFIIRFGAMPVSKAYLHYQESHRNTLQFIIENYSGYRNPTHSKTNYIKANGERFCQDLITYINRREIESIWLKKWQYMNTRAKQVLLKGQGDSLTEDAAVRCLLEEIPPRSKLFCGNSMAVRDLDTTFTVTDKMMTVLANRGVSGIDGVVSSALGVAASSTTRVTLLIGDLSFYHDLNGLLAAKHYDLDITIILVNNDGGGIFSFLPQKQHEKHFEKLFGTPLGINFKHVVHMYNGHYRNPETLGDLRQDLNGSYKKKGITVIEVKTNRDENLKSHQLKWNQLEEMLTKED